MGLAGVLVKRVLSKSRSLPISSRAGNERSCLDKKSRWSSVRLLYLCGDEFNAVGGEDDMASIKSSGATIVQPVVEAPCDEESSPVTKSEEVEELILKEELSSKKFLSQEDAAIFIQSAFRSFMARHRCKKIGRSSERDHTEGLESPAAASMASSTEVQIGESFDTLTLSESSIVMQHQMHQKARPQVFRMKEDWDDSTVSCNVSKLRIQNRLEATTRRERALAYAFSQQLRTCGSTKRRSTESNVGWSWLERWMATRPPENSTTGDCLSKHFDSIPTARRTIVIEKRSDVAVEEKESCGSNDVSVSFDSSKTPSHTLRSGYRPVGNKLKATGSVLQRRTASDYRSVARPNKVSKKEHRREMEKEKGRSKQEEPKNQVKIEGCDVCQPPSEC